MYIWISSLSTASFRFMYVSSARFSSPAVVVFCYIFLDDTYVPRLTCNLLILISPHNSRSFCSSTPLCFTSYLWPFSMSSDKQEKKEVLPQPPVLCHSTQGCRKREMGGWEMRLCISTTPLLSLVYLIIGLVPVIAGNEGRCSSILKIYVTGPYDADSGR